MYLMSQLRATRIIPDCKNKAPPEITAQLSQVIRSSSIKTQHSRIFPRKIIAHIQAHSWEWWRRIWWPGSGSTYRTNSVLLQCMHTCWKPNDIDVFLDIFRRNCLSYSSQLPLILRLYPMRIVCIYFKIPCMSEGCLARYMLEKIKNASSQLRIDVIWEFV